jgi:anti-sigma regulatory factor (Ser/Thr protein kinase)
LAIYLAKKKIKQVSKIQEIFDVIELSESGRGLFIMNKLMDEVKFEKKEDLCIAKMKKNLENF